MDRNLLIWFLTFLFCSSIDAYQHSKDQAGDIYPYDDKTSCVFPFVYNNAVYNDCTFDSSNGPFPFCSLSNDWWGKFTYCYDFLNSTLQCVPGQYELGGTKYTGCNKIPPSAPYEQCATNNPDYPMRYCVEKYLKKSGKNLLRFKECDQVLKNLSDFHTGCIGPSDYAIPVNITEADKVAILSKHNSYREDANATCMMKLYWDNELAKMAQAQANMCAFDHDLAKNRLIPIYGWLNGQNMVLSSELRLPLATLLDMMFKAEKARFVLDQGCINGAGSCLHYTQLMISTLTRVGCAVTHCLYPDRALRILVCNYIQSQYSDTYMSPYKINGSIASCCPKKKVGKSCDCGNKICKYDQWEVIEPNTCECIASKRKRDVDDDDNTVLPHGKPFALTFNENDLDSYNIEEHHPDDVPQINLAKRSL